MSAAETSSGKQVRSTQRRAPRRQRNGRTTVVEEGDTSHLGPPTLGSSRDDLVQLRLLGGVALVVDGATISMPSSAAKVIAYVALAAPSPVERSELAGVLWPDTPDVRAAASLRSALYRVRGRCDELLETTTSTVRLQPHVWLDVDHPVDAWWSVDGDQPMPRAIPPLLPGWYDDWVIHERERVRQNVLHDLEASARAFLGVGAHATAIDMALQAAACEPLRETPRRLAIEAHVAEGNIAEAIREFERFATLLREELAIEPSKSLADFMESVTMS